MKRSLFALALIVTLAAQCAFALELPAPVVAPVVRPFDVGAVQLLDGP